MLDSVHTYRWLSQFEDSKIDFCLFPSRKFRKIHPELLKLITNTKPASTFKLVKPLSLVPLRFLGYLDFAFKKLSTIGFSRVRSNIRLRKLLKTNRFDYVHLLEIQGAGYLYLESVPRIKPGWKLIVTNWGSDIYFFQKFDNHKKLICDLLKLADAYSAECNRDYELAKKLGFSGTALPCHPNAGGFASPLNVIPSSSRDLILCKAYGDEFGLGLDVIDAATKFLGFEQKFHFHFYSVTDDLISKVNYLQKCYPQLVSFSTRRGGLTHKEMIALFQKARVYIGASKSDGISTSFLEALVYGAYPIQTDTSCASEWIKLGFKGSTIKANSVDEILDKLKSVVFNDVKLTQAQEINQFLAKVHLEKNKIKQDSQLFYKFQ